MGRIHQIGKTAGRLLVSQVVLASILVAHAIPALHFCPEIGSISRHSHSPAREPCHGKEHREGVSHSDSQSIVQEDDDATSPKHNHDLCPICQGYLTIQDLQQAESYALLIYSEKSVYPLPSPPISISEESVSYRARDPPSKRLS